MIDWTKLREAIANGSHNTHGCHGCGGACDETECVHEECDRCGPVKCRVCKKTQDPYAEPDGEKDDGMLTCWACRNGY